MSDREQTVCPRCGHDIDIVGEHPMGEQTRYHVECPDCGVAGPMCETFNDAVTAWECVYPIIVERDQWKARAELAEYNISAMWNAGVER